jgi:hypothetical protein
MSCDRHLQQLLDLKKLEYVRFEIHTAVAMKVTEFCGIMPCGPVEAQNISGPRSKQKKTQQETGGYACHLRFTVIVFVDINHHPVFI